MEQPIIEESLGPNSGENLGTDNRLTVVLKSMEIELFNMIINYNLEKIMEDREFENVDARGPSRVPDLKVQSLSEKSFSIRESSQSLSPDI